MRNQVATTWSFGFNQPTHACDGSCSGGVASAQVGGDEAKAVVVPPTMLDVTGSSTKRAAS
jgi:hypothetical protein